MRAALEQLAEVVYRASGIRIAPSRLDALTAATAKLAPEADPHRLLRATRDPDFGPALIDRLVDAVAVKETYFLRERDELERLDWAALAASAEADGRDHLRVWSVGCATGEEAYTLALLASEALGPEPPVRVLATDISHTALAAARRGRYGERSVSNLDPDLRSRYLHSDGDSFVVTEALRRLVDFRHHNLVAGPAVAPGDARAFDLIVCRNVLIYFDDATARRVIAALERTLAPGGTLLLGVVDRLSRARAPRRRTAGGPRLARSAPKAGGRRFGRRAAGPAPSRAPGGGTPTAPAGRATPPVRAEPATSERDAVMQALELADAGRVDAAKETLAEILATEPMNPAALLARGTVELSCGEADAAVGCFRSALYADPSLVLASFYLGRAYDALDREDEARRAYEQALRAVQPYAAEEAQQFPDVDLADVAAACRLRLGAAS